MISINRQKAKNIANNILLEDLQYRGLLFCVLSQYVVWLCDDRLGRRRRPIWHQGPPKLLFQLKELKEVKAGEAWPE